MQASFLPSGTLANKKILMLVARERGWIDLLQKNYLNYQITKLFEQKDIDVGSS